MVSLGSGDDELSWSLHHLVHVDVGVHENVRFDQSGLVSQELRALPCKIIEVGCCKGFKGLVAVNVDTIPELWLANVHVVD